MIQAPVEPGLEHELLLLVRSRYPLVVVEGADEARVRTVAATTAHHLSLPFLRWSSVDGLVRPGVAPIRETSDPAAALAKLVAMEGDWLALMCDLQPYFERPEVVRLLREMEQRKAGTRSTVVLSGLDIRLPPELRPLASRLQTRLPDPRELERIVRRTARELAAQRRSSVELEGGQFAEMASALAGLHSDEARRALYQVALEDGRLAADDIPWLRRNRQRRLEQGSQLEWVEALPGLSQLGGLPELKTWVERRREGFSEAARLFGVDEPRGLLLVGVPGTGKSLACRALAGEWELPLLRLDAGRLYDKYVGESEANLRRALEAAEAMSPAVLWLDEIEKALASGDGSADAGLSQRILGTLLTWMQDRERPVFVAATSNDVSKLPMELLRRGRFDEIFFVDLPDAEERRMIFEIQLRRRERPPERFDLERLAERTEGFSGAEIEAVIVAALYHAFNLRQELSQEVVEAEIAGARPLSVVRPEAVERLRRWGREHAVRA